MFLKNKWVIFFLLTVFGGLQEIQAETGNDEISQIFVGNIDHTGNSTFELSENTELSFQNAIEVPSLRKMTLEGESGKLSFGGTVTFKNSSGTSISKVFDYIAKGY